MKPLRLVLVELTQVDQRKLVLELTRDYFRWMDAEMEQAIGLPLSEVVGMDVEEYLTSVMDTICRSSPPESAFHLAFVDDQAVGMGGLRRLPDGSAEVVRIYTRPEFRGRGIGKLLVDEIVEEARRFGYATLKLDTGLFMSSAHKIYRAAGFEEIAPYEGAEPPDVLKPVWLYMQKRL